MHTYMISYIHMSDTPTHLPQDTSAVTLNDRSPKTT